MTESAHAATMSSKIVWKVKLDGESSFGQKTFVFGQVFYFEHSQSQRVSDVIGTSTHWHTHKWHSSTMTSQAIFFFLLLTNIKKVSRSHVYRDETAGESGGGRTWSTFLWLRSFIFDTHSYVWQTCRSTTQNTGMTRITFYSQQQTRVSVLGRSLRVWTLVKSFYGSLQIFNSIFWTCLRL